MKLLVYDFETLSLSHNAHVLDFGWCIIDTKKEIHSALAAHGNIIPGNHFNDGRDIDPKTVAWWLEQTKDKELFDYLNSILNNRVIFEHVDLEFFRDCVEFHKVEATACTNKEFDFMLFRDFIKWHAPNLWDTQFSSHRMHYDTRVLSSLFPEHEWSNNINVFSDWDGPPHVAVSDAIYLASSLYQIYYSLGR